MKANVQVSHLLRQFNPLHILTLHFRNNYSFNQPCTQLYQIYKDVIKTNNSYMFRVLLAHRQGVQKS